MPIRCLVYAHFNAQGALDGNVVATLRWLRSQVSCLVFVSSSTIEHEQLAKLNALCDIVHLRENVGYDFGSWKVGIGLAKPLHRFDEVILMNDSVFGPIDSSSKVMDRVSALPFDICGLTASWEGEWHIQSWFVCYKRAAVQTQAFETFWQNVAPCESKQELIQKYEVGLSAAMRGSGLSMGVLYDPPAHVSRLERLLLWLQNASLAEPVRSQDCLRLLWHTSTLNPTHYLWFKLIERGIPFIKRELVNSNPLHLNTSRIFRRYPELRGQN